MNSTALQTVDISFLVALLASSGAIAAFLNNRNQYLSGLICKKAEYIFDHHNELEPKEVEIIMAQLTLLRVRNRVVETSVIFSIISSIAFAVYIYLLKLPLSKSISVIGWICILSGVALLILSFYFAMIEFVDSTLVLDLEILLARFKYKKTGFLMEKKLGENDLLMYGKTEKQQKEYLEDLLNQAQKKATEQQVRIARRLLHAQETIKASQNECESLDPGIEVDEILIEKLNAIDSQ